MSLSFFVVDIELEQEVSSESNEMDKGHQLREYIERKDCFTQNNEGNWKIKLKYIHETLYEQNKFSR